MFGRRALIAALVLLFGAGGAQAGSEGRAHSFSPEGLAKVSDYIRSEVAAGTFPGAIPPAAPNFARWSKKCFPLRSPWPLPEISRLPIGWKR